MRRFSRIACAVSSAALLAFAAGCSHRSQSVYTPPPPSIPATSTPVNPATAGDQGIVGQPPVGTRSEQSMVESRTPVYSEIGMASWYGPPYHNRRGANGQVYDQNAISAAHRTLPMGSLIRVTNLATGQSAVMRITDRGPFVPDRVIDLSVGAAKAVGVWRPGTARVRIDVYEAPKPIDEGGRWCVQVGAFLKAGNAKKLEEHLSRKYETANVIEFAGPTGHWVRIRPANDDRGRAMELAKDIKPKEGEAYLVRLD